MCMMVVFLAMVVWKILPGNNWRGARVGKRGEGLMNSHENLSVGGLI